jgi:phospholipid/cholesterol/gamma-HCH transport system substrate-binding protein
MRNALGASIKLAVFAVVTLVLTGILAATVANTGFASGSEYTAMFTDASGLQEGDDVRMHGVKIGQITSLEVRDDRLAAVGFAVDRERSVPAGVTAVIRYRNLIGQRYLALDAPTQPSGPPMSPGATIPLDHTRPALSLTDLFNGFQPLFRALTPNDVNQLSAQIIQVFQGEGPSVEQLLTSTASLSNTLADRGKVIGQVITNLNTVLGNVSARSPELGQLLDTLQSLITGLSKDRRPIGDAVDALGDLTDTTAHLVDAARPSLHDDIGELRRLAGMLNDNNDTVESHLKDWGPKLDRVIPAAGYGSWFQYYSCIVSGKISIEQLGITIPILPIPGTQLPVRCRP